MDDPQDGEAEEANTKLNEGLETCRAVVSNYRALLSKKRAKAAANDEQPGDEPEAPTHSIDPAD